MKLIPKISFIFLITLILITISCSKKEDFSDIPYIEFKSFYKLSNVNDIDSVGVIEFSFTDGDGDIGLSEWDSDPPYDFNLFITYFEKQEGEFKEVILTAYNNQTGEYDTINLDYRIPVINNTGQEKSLKGKIELELNINNPSSDYDTIRFDLFIKDRALHESNTISTPEIIVKKK